MSSGIRVLFLTQVVPYPPDSGPKVKTYHVLRYLAEHGHRVTLVSFVRKEEEPHLDQLKSYCDAIHTVPMRRSHVKDVVAFANSLFSGLAFLVARDAKREMYALVSRLLREQSFDVIHADQLTMAQYAVQLPTSNFPLPNPPSLVFDAHNAVWTIVERSRQTARFFLRLLLALEARRLKKYEGGVCRSVDAVLAVSEADKRALVEAGADADKITVIPIAVDSSNVPQMDPGNKPPNILTVSTLFYPPNADGVRWFIHQVYPLIRKAMPVATLTIVGPRPPQDIVEFAARHSQCATVTGYVHDLQPYLERAAVMVVPVRAASGMRVRILQALARGIPVVTTTTGVEGIDAVNGEHLIIADEPQQFANAVTCLLQDIGLRRRLAENGRRLVQDKYDWRVALPRLEQIYQSIVKR
jgi:glycosyltransferase involved in cell wall biosynthesis